MKPRAHGWLALLVAVALPGSRAAPTPVEGYLSAAALVGVSDGSSGSGFYWNREGTVFFVTARHLLLVTNTVALDGSLRLKSNRALLRSPVPAESRVNIFALDLEKLQVTKRIRFHPSHDIAAIEVGSIATNQPNLPLRLSLGIRDVSGNPADTGLACVPQHVLPLKDIVAGTGCFLVGYATSLDVEAEPRAGVDPTRPWARSGRIMAVNFKQGTILVGSRVFPGDSGGPVFEIEAGSPNPWRGRFIGVISQYVDVTALGKSEDEDPAESFWDKGYTVVESADALMELMSSQNSWTLR